MRRNDDPTLEIKGFAERVLPKANCFRVRNWREAVVQDYFLNLHGLIITIEEAFGNRTGMEDRVMS